MRKFWHNTRENKTLQEQFNKQQGNVDCEEVIISDKERFGRVRKSTMQLLREQYGSKTADRALWRVSARKSRGYLQEKSQLNQYSNQQDLVQLFSLLSSLDTSKDRLSSGFHA